MGDITAKDVMVSEFSVLDEITSLAQLREHFEKNKSKHVFISRRGVVAGIVSDRDVLRRISPFLATQAQKKQDEDTLKITAADFMSQKIISVRSTDLIKSVVQTILSSKVACMPVMEANEIKGYINWKSFVPYFTNKTTKCEQVMTRSIISVVMDTKLTAMINLFVKHGIHHLPVVENGRILGMISDRDVLRLTSPFLGGDHEREQDREAMNKRAHHFMARKLITITPDVLLIDAVKILIEKGISCLPVVINGDQIQGIITWRDFLKQFVLA